VCEASAAAPQTCSMPCGWVGDHSRAPIFTRREYRCRPGLHRPGCGGSTPPSRRVRVASIAAMQRSLKPQSTGQHRGDPPFRRRGSVATRACARPQRCAPSALAARKCSLRRPHLLKEQARLKKVESEPALRAVNSAFCIHTSAFTHASVVKLPSSWWPCASTFERRVCG
jgi:hypothetical protein